MKAIRQISNKLASMRVHAMLKMEGEEWSGTVEGLPALLKRHPTGKHWMGWVQVPEHYDKLYGKNLHTCIHWPQCVPEKVPEVLSRMTKQLQQWRCNHRPYMMLKDTVHGGVSFAGKIKGHEGWWIGFDAGHVGDLSPGVLRLPGAMKMKLPPYRDKKFCLGELGKLARKIKASSAH